MGKTNRKKSTYYIYTKDEQQELKGKKLEMALGTSFSAIGALGILVVALGSCLGDKNISAADLVAMVFSGGTAWLGLASRIINGVEYARLEDKFQWRAEREGRVRK